ncbi:MAG: ankyrin repeat domain-containing protein [Spirochaetota bacterium]
MSLILVGEVFPLTYQTRSGEQDLDFQFDVPSGWERMVGKRKSSAYASFFKDDPAGKVAIEVYSYRADNANLDLLLLQQRARLAVVFDRVLLQQSQVTANRDDIRKHEWTAWQGKTRYRLVTSFLRTDDRVLKIFCVAPEKRFRSYAPVFENAVLSFSFADGKHSAGDALVAKPALTEARPAPKATSVRPAVTKETTRTPPANPYATRDLFVAVKARNLGGAQKALAEEANINAVDAEGKSPLSYAVELEDAQMAQYLREHGGLDSIAGRRMLRAIAANNVTEFVRAMDDSADPNYTDKFGNTPLLVAAAYGNAEILQTLMDLKANVHAADADGYTALFYAAQENHVRIIDLLLAAGAEVNAQSRFGFSPLHIAAARGQRQAVQRLLQAGADINAVAKQGGTAAYWAALAGHDEVADLLVKSGSVDYHHNFELAQAARTSNVVLARSALRATELAIDMQDIEGNSALFYAAVSGATEVARLLIERGANVNLLNHQGQSALLVATLAGHVAVVELLLQARANTEVKDAQGRSAVMHAAWKGNGELVKMLVQARADVNRQDNEGWTALMLATHAGHLPVVQMLVSGRAKTRTKNSRQQTALDIANAQGAQQVAQVIRQGR